MPFPGPYQISEIEFKLFLDELVESALFGKTFSFGEHFFREDRFKIRCQKPLKYLGYGIKKLQSQQWSMLSYNSSETYGA